MKSYQYLFLLLTITGTTLFQCTTPDPKTFYLNTVLGEIDPSDTMKWLSHEHILVDFIGADSIRPETWHHDSISLIMLPYLEKIKNKGVDIFVDATPQFLGRDPVLLQKLSEKSGLHIITNTGLYGARNNKFIPNDAAMLDPEALAEMWIAEFENGINGSGVKPGFIKIGIDTADPLDALHQKLVKAAGITNLKTGLTIASHTGEAKGLWPQLQILEEMGVPLDAFIWVHAQAEKDSLQYIKAAEKGCWISLDGIGYDIEEHLAKLIFAKQNNILDHILISHDAGWYDPQKEIQEITPFTNIFDKLIPELLQNGFSDDEVHLLLSINPQKAFSIIK